MPEFIIAFIVGFILCWTAITILRFAAMAAIGVIDFIEEVRYIAGGHQR